MREHNEKSDDISKLLTMNTEDLWERYVAANREASELEDQAASLRSELKIILTALEKNTQVRKGHLGDVGDSGKGLLANPKSKELGKKSRQINDL